MINRGKCFNNKTVISNKIYELMHERKVTI